MFALLLKRCSDEFEKIKIKKSFNIISKSNNYVPPTLIFKIF